MNNLPTRQPPSQTASSSSSAYINSGSSSSAVNKGAPYSQGYYKPPPPSTVAATAAAFAAKPRESALSKAKMFALQAAIPHSSQFKSSSSASSQKKKTDLTIQTMGPLPGRPSLSERSPLTRPSRELERIASIASQNVSPMTTSSRDSEKHKNHYHLSFRSGKNTHGSTVLSSSSSNSKLVSEQGSIYTFHPSSPGGVNKSLSALELRSLASKEERDYIADESWSLLKSRVLQLFQGEGLRVPVEDLNDLVAMHINSRIQQGVDANDILVEFKDLTKIGMQKLDYSLQKVNDAKLMSRVVELWQFFFSQVLPYWEAIFLPLQLELEGNGYISVHHWATLTEGTDTAMGSTGLSIKLMTLIAFRDWVIIPVADRLKGVIQQTQMDINDTAARFFQCTSILASIHSKDENQHKIDDLAKIVKSTWLSRSRKSTPL